MQVLPTSHPHHTNADSGAELNKIATAYSYIVHLYRPRINQYDEMQLDHSTSFQKILKASISIEQPRISSPAHEWAAGTADALANASPSEHGTAHMTTPGLGEEQPTPPASTPQSNIPGAFPTEPHDAVDHLANAALTKEFDVNEHWETVKQYVPAHADVQRAVGSVGETARDYLPERMVNTLGLPVGTTDTAAVDSKLRPTQYEEKSSSSVDNASTTAVATSTRSNSLQTKFSDGNEDMSTQLLNSGNGPAVAGIATSIDTNPYELSVSKTPTRFPLPESHTEVPSPPHSSTHVSPAQLMLLIPPLSQNPSASSANDFPLPNSRSKGGDVDDKSDSESDVERIGGGKKGSRTRRMVEKVKDKLHRNH
ncbi:hypothetical protein EW145_g5252 [Phellinidium pouzarii]|uniref:Uncharacterized protein n=1 Tax=Phellinidium pouzarii TaxID=167371 RepID=A0A4S4L165_9AGAM|nr:hypothetical protein EW145_g5252 [Phellinidium pouzarii]